MVMEKHRSWQILAVSIIFVTFLLSSLANAVSLGNIPPRKKVIFIKPGDAVKIPLVFFTTDPKSVVLELSVPTKIYSNEYGKDLYINFVDSQGNVVNSVVLPGGTVTTSPQGKGPWIVIPGTNKYVRAKVVYLSIYVPNKPVFFKNIYKITVLAKTQPDVETVQGESTKISQEREYHFTIRILNAKAIPQVSFPAEETSATSTSFLSKTKESVDNYMKNFFKILKNGVNKLKSLGKKNAKANEENKNANENKVLNNGGSTQENVESPSSTSKTYNNPGNELNNVESENKAKANSQNKISGKAIKNESSAKKVNKTTIAIIIAGTIFLIILAKS